MQGLAHAITHPPGPATCYVRCSACSSLPIRSNDFIAHALQHHPREVGSSILENEAHLRLEAAAMRSIATRALAYAGRLDEALGSAAQELESRQPQAVQLEANTQLQQLRAESAELQGALRKEQHASNFFENRFRRSEQRRVSIERLEPLCPVAETHQRLHERGLFNPATHPLHATTEQLHLDTLKRIDLGPELVRKGGAGLQLCPSSKAKWYYLWNNSHAQAYRMEAALHGGPRMDHVSTYHKNEFAAVGTPRE